MEQYSLAKTFGKGIKYFIIFALPIMADKLIVAYPDWAQLTVGGLLVMLVNWLKVSVAPKLGWAKRKV